MKRTNSLGKFSLLVVVLISATYFATTSNLSTGVITNKPIKIGFFSAETSASLSFYSYWSKQGFELGMSYATNNTNTTLAGRPIEIQFYDTKGLVADAISLAEAAITRDGVDILVGGTYSDVAGAIAKVAEVHQKLFFIVPGADADLTGKDFNPYTFRIARNNWMDAYAGVTYAIETLGAQKFAFFAADYTFGYSGVDTMTNVISEKGGSVVLVQYAPLTTTDFSPYISNILTAEENVGIDYLFFIWSGNFGYLWQDVGEFNITSGMNVGGAVIDIYSINAIEESLSPPHTLEGSTGLCLYGYELPDNPVNDWMVQEHINRNIRPSAEFSTHEYRVPELFTASGFATAQFLVNVTNEVASLDIYDMITHLESNLTIVTPKGDTFLRPADHQALAEFYIAEIWNDTRPSSETYGYLVPRLIERLRPDEVTPPIESNWIPGSLTKPRKTSGTTVFIPLVAMIVLPIIQKRKKESKVF
jgi:branched-chain amino acid transport system substrate-binding protein